MNENPVQNGIKTQFSRENQPPKKGRKKSIFGALGKENSLSLDDVRKVYKNILTAKSFMELEKVRKKYPSLLTELTIDMLRQDKLGRIIGKQTVVVDENGNTIKVIGERIKSYETIQYMLDRIYGVPNKVDLNITGGLQLVKITDTDEDALA